MYGVPEFGPSIRPHLRNSRQYYKSQTQKLTSLTINRNTYYRSYAAANVFCRVLLQGPGAWDHPLRALSPAQGAILLHDKPTSPTFSGAMDASGEGSHKAHRASRTKKKKSTNSGTGGKKNAVAKPGAFARRIRLSADRAEKRAANPTAPVDRTGGDDAPRVVAVVGPKGVGKSTIIRNLVKHYSKRNVPTITGPITIVVGRKKRITFLEVGPDLSSMIDAAKVADLVLLVIDASFGFEMETFEFLNIAAAHGMPKVMGVLTHLDDIRDGKQVRRAKKTFKDRIWAELYDGAKIFYLSGITTSGDYLNREVLNLARFISVTKYANLRWRADHPYVLADRVEDITPKSLPSHANRSVAAYGYVRGSPLRPAAGEWRIHLAGVGDLVANNVEILPDPCPPPEVHADSKLADSDMPDAAAKRVRRKVSERERIVYAPMAPEVDGISYDRDAIYVNLPAGSVRFSDKAVLVPDGNATGKGDSDSDESSDGEGEKMVKSLQKSSGEAVDESLRRVELQLVKGGKRIVSDNFEDDRRRRLVDFTGPTEDDADAGESDNEGDSDGDSADGSDGDSESDRDRDSESESDEPGGQTKDADDSNDSDQEQDLSKEEDNDDDDEEAAAQVWKNKMLDNAAANLQMSVSPSKALAKHVYKKAANGEYVGESVEKSTHENLDSGSDDADDAFFTPKRRRSGAGVASFSSAVLDDVTRLLPNATRDWISDKKLCAQLKRKRFGTGQRRDTDDASGSEDGDGTPIDGDFEDLETGEVHRGGSAGDGSGIEKEQNDSDSDIEAIRERKIQRKHEFNAEWDKKGGKQQVDEEEDTEDGKDTRPHDVRSRKALRDAAERVPDARKLERERLDKIRNEEMRGLDQETRMALEGILPGRYIRLELQDVPMEFVKYFNPNCPIVIGGLKPSDDEGKTFLRARVRRHRFKRGVLKSTDPVVFSIGWRRFQSVPVYDTEDQGGRRRFIKYTPEYLHCNATFWGPGVAPGAGVILCQSLGRERAGFRIAGSGVVTEVNTSFEIVKKLKLIGEPVKVHKNTAFIKGMFNSELEVSKYIGANLRTVSGIRGTIKKAISETAQRGSLDREIAKSPAGTFRAGFEDRILLSDIVFLRAWVPVVAPKFCSIATTLLDKERQGNGNGTWRMRTIREVREAKQLPIPLNKDSLYAPVERADPIFAPLKIPKKLEGALPYASKPKNFVSKKDKRQKTGRKADISEERAVVLDPREKSQQKLLQAVYTIRNERTKKRKDANKKRLARRRKEFEREEAKHEKTAAERRKRKFALEGAQENREPKRRKKDEDDD